MRASGGEVAHASEVRRLEVESSADDLMFLDSRLRENDDN